MIPVKDNIPAERFAVATLTLVALNVGFYIWARDDALLPLAANLLFLWIFGGSLEEAMGRLRFLAFYLFGGLVAVGAALALGADTVPIVGASGAAAAILGGYLVHYPRGRVLTVLLIPFLFTIVAIPAVIFLGLWAALQIAFALLDLNGAISSHELVEYLAPVAGLLFGAVAVKLFATRRSAGYASEAPLGESA